jgi:O-antigen/teichoic acid export membrane protein
VYSVVVFIIAFGIHFSQQQMHVLLLMLLLQISLSFYNFMRSTIAALHLFRTDSILSVLDKVIAIILCCILFTELIPGLRMQIDTFIFAQIISYCTVCCMGLYIILNREKISFKLNFSSTREVIKKSFPFALLTFLMTVYYRIDAVMIERMLGNDGTLEAGIYASGYRLLDALNILGLLFATILLPMFSRMFEQKLAVKPLTELAHNIVLTISATCGITFYIYRKEIMNFLYVNADAYYGTLFGWLMLSFICISMIYIYGTLLTAKGKLRELNMLTFCAMLLNIILNILLIPAYKALGAAIATVCTQLLVLILHIFLTQKLIKIDMPGTFWLRSVLFPVFFSVFAFCIYNLQLPIFVGIFISLAGGTILSIVLRFFRWQQVINLLKTYLLGAS